MSTSEITAHESNDDEPLTLDSVSSSANQDEKAREPTEESSLSGLTSVVTSTYSSFTSLLNRGASDFSEATKKLPGQFQNLAAGGTKVVTQLTGGLADFIAQGMHGADKAQFEEPSFDRLRTTFGLSASDSLIGSFICELLQTYHAADNTFSPNVEVSFPVLISVTEEVLCLVVEHSGSDYPGKVCAREIIGLSPIPGKDSLVLKMTDDRQAVLKNFGGEDSKLHAQKLMQHLVAKYVA